MDTINILVTLDENYLPPLHPIHVDGSLFSSATANSRYPQEMYYRLLAPHLLPGTLGRVLYLDPDTMVINPLRPLWNLEMQGFLFAAAAHTGKTEIANGSALFPDWCAVNGLPVNSIQSFGYSLAERWMRSHTAQ